MARVFVSYAREDREAAAVLAYALQAARHEVWWDRALVAGQDYTAVIEQQLSDADAVVVLWSTVSVKSKFVRDEANHALQSGRLTPVRIEPVALPLGFASLHSADVFSQDEDGHTVLEPAVLVDEVARRLDAAAGSPKAAPSFSPKPTQRSAPRRAGLPWLWAGGAAVLAAVGTAVTLNWMDQPEQHVVRAAADPAASAPAASAVAAGPAVPDAASAVSAAGATTAAAAAVAAKAAAERERERERKLQAQREALMKRKNDDLLRQNEQLRQDAIEKERVAIEQKAAEEAAAEQARRREQERQAAIEEQKRKEEAQRLADAKRKEEEAKKGEPPVGSGSVTVRKPIDPKVLSQIAVKPSTITLPATQRASVINRAAVVPAASAVKP
jgi:hypothetical protein